MELLGDAHCPPCLGRGRESQGSWRGSRPGFLSLPQQNCLELMRIEVQEHRNRAGGVSSLPSPFLPNHPPVLFCISVHFLPPKKLSQVWWYNPVTGYAESRSPVQGPAWATFRGDPVSGKTKKPETLNPHSPPGN
jgi:hypothetical protein